MMSVWLSLGGPFPRGASTALLSRSSVLRLTVSNSDLRGILPFRPRDRVKTQTGSLEGAGEKRRRGEKFKGISMTVVLY